MVHFLFSLVHYFLCEDTVIYFSFIFLLLDLFSSVVTCRKVFLVSFFDFLRGYYLTDDRKKKICSHLLLIYCTSQYNYNFSNLHVTEMKRGQENIKLKRENISKQVVID